MSFSSFNEANEDVQYNVLNSIIPRLEQIKSLLSEVDDLYFFNGFTSPYPVMSDPIIAQALEDAETAIGHVENKLNYKRKQVTEVLLKANEIQNRQLTTGGVK